MYRIYDEDDAIREIQKYLHYISDTLYEELPLVAIDGIFGEETREAVRIYQEISSIPASGIVDYLTFDSLYRDYKSSIATKNSGELYINADKFPFSMNDRGPDVLLINFVLSEMQGIHGEISDVRINEYYSKDTESAVRDIQGIFLMPIDGKMDLALYTRMLYELKNS